MTCWSIHSNVAQYGGAAPGPAWPNETGRASGLTVEQAQQRAAADPEVTYFFYCRQRMDLSNYGKGVFNPGDAVFFSGQPWWGSAPQCDSYVKETVPRNEVWVGDSSSPPTDATLANLVVSDYTHVIICFLHFDPGLKLVYNGPYPVSDFDSFWPKLQILKNGPKPKTLMISIGGWGSGTWQCIIDQEAEAAKILADFVIQNGFDGLDVNFEAPLGVNGYPNTVYRNELAWLNLVAKFVTCLRAELGTRILTIAPMQDNIAGSHGQLEAINRAVQPVGKDWRDVLSWINAQFYHYNYAQAVPYPDVVQGYKDLLGQCSITPDRMVAGFPLEGTDGPEYLTYNVAELQTASADVRELVTLYPQFAGAFVWNYDATRYPADLNWASTIQQALQGNPSMA